MSTSANTNMFFTGLLSTIEYQKFMKSIGYSDSGMYIDRRLTPDLFHEYRFNRLLERKFGKDNKILEKYNKHNTDMKFVDSCIMDDEFNIQYIIKQFMEFLEYTEKVYFTKVSDYYNNDKDSNIKELLIDSKNVRFSIKFEETEIEYPEDEEADFKFKLLDFLNNDLAVEEDDRSKVTFCTTKIERKDSYSTEFNSVYPDEYKFESDIEKTLYSNACISIKKFIKNKYHVILDEIVNNGYIL